MDILEQQGNIYAYLLGKLNIETSEVGVRAINSLQYEEEEFVEEFKELKNECLNSEETNDKIIEIYCIIGKKDKIAKIENLFRKKLKNVFNQIISSKEIYSIPQITTSTPLETLLNIYLYDLVVSKIMYPDYVIFQKDNLYFLCYFLTDNPNHNLQEFIPALIQTWDNYEKIELYGKQALTQSFLRKNLEERKIIAYTNDSSLEKPFYLIEGGYKLFLDEENFSGTKIGFRELPIFSITDVDEIISNPIYAYGENYYPSFLFIEWKKVFDYVLATSNINWTSKKLKIVYEEFLKFMKNEICEIEYTDSIITKEKYYQCYLKNLNNTKEYFSGNEEAIISKDYFLLLRTRKIYLKPLITLVQKIFPNNYDYEKSFSLSDYESYLCKLESKNTSEKGKILEDIAEYLLNCTKEFKVTGKRKKTNRGELDVCCCNISNDSVLWQLGAFIFIECKNWNKKVNVKVIRELGYIMLQKGNSTTILFSSSGITKEAEKEIRRLAIHSKYIITLDKEDLKQIKRIEDFIDCLKFKYQQIQKQIENDLELLG